MKILVADDDATIRSELAELLESKGHEVREAADGREALTKLGAEPFDAALVDVVMPKANGLEVLRESRGASGGTAVIMISGKGTIDIAVEAMKSGAVDFVQKPFEVETLQRALQSLEEEQRTRKVLRSPLADGAAIRALLADAARRRALLAVVGPAGSSPPGAHRTLRISQDPRPPDVFTPGQLYRLNAALEEHVRECSRPVVYMSDLGLLERAHGHADIESWIRQVGNKCAAREGRLVLTTRDARFARDLAHGFAADGGLQSILESLANPIRRAIVSFVFATGPALYSEILKRNFADSSSKLSFHLQKLLSDRLLRKGAHGRYELTEDGQRAWDTVRFLSQSSCPRPILLA